MINEYSEYPKIWMMPIQSAIDSLRNEERPFDISILDAPYSNLDLYIPVLMDPDSKVIYGNSFVLALAEKAKEEFTLFVNVKQLIPEQLILFGKAIEDFKYATCPDLRLLAIDLAKAIGIKCLPKYPFLS